MYIGERAEIFYMDNTVGNWQYFLFVCTYVWMYACYLYFDPHILDLVNQAAPWYQYTPEEVPHCDINNSFSFFNTIGPFSQVLSHIISCLYTASLIATTSVSMSQNRVKYKPV